MRYGLQQNQIEQNFEEKMLPNVFYEQVQGFEGLAVGDKIGQRQDYKLHHCWPTGARRGCNFPFATLKNTITALVSYLRD